MQLFFQGLQKDAGGGKTEALCFELLLHVGSLQMQIQDKEVLAVMGTRLRTQLSNLAGCVK